MTLLTAHLAPATTITTTTETLAANIAPMAIIPPVTAQGLVIRGVVVVTTGTGVTGLTVKLRAGNNNTTTAQVDVSETAPAGASAPFEVPFEFSDATIQDLATGYSITVTQAGATGNGTVTAVDYDVDLAAP